MSVKRLKAPTAAKGKARVARVLVVPDKFKGTLTAAEACNAIAKGWKCARPGDQLDLLPMCDGGDGFGEVMSRLLKAQHVSVRTLDAAHQPIRADWAWVPSEKLAIIEAARVIGLAMLAPKRFHPFQLDTFGLGRVLEEAADLGARKCLIGIGGSATNDGGFGLARALGWKFANRLGRELEQWWQLANVVKVLPPPARKLPLDITVAVDVANPLLGPKGCTRVYGLQKGIRPEDIPYAEKCLRRLKTVLEQELNLKFATVPGAGAAGGLGFGLMAFAGARPRSGFEIFASTARLKSRIDRSDLVITGEGAIDQQTCMGKGVGQIIQLCQKLKTPCLALAGTVSANVKAPQLRDRTFALTDITTFEQAKKNPRFHLENLSAKVAGDHFPL